MSGRERDVALSRLPRRNTNDRIEDIGLFSVMSVLSAHNLPVFAVPRREDYGLDLLVQITTSEYAGNRELDYLNDEFARLLLDKRLARLNDRGPDHVAVVGAIFAVQVKTSSRFGKRWNVAGLCTPEQRNYWGNCPFPVIVVGCHSVTRELRWAIAEQRTGPLILDQPFDSHAVQTVTELAVRDVVLNRGCALGLGIFSDEPEQQMKGVRACWATFDDSPMLLRALQVQVARLAPLPRDWAVRLLVCLLDRLASDDDCERAQAMECGAGTLQDLPIETAWACFDLIEQGETGFMRRPFHLDEESGVALAIGYDPFPTGGRLDGLLGLLSMQRALHLSPGGRHLSAARLLASQRNSASMLKAVLRRIALDDEAVSAKAAARLWLLRIERILIEQVWMDGGSSEAVSEAKRHARLLVDAERPDFRAYLAESP